MSLRDMIFKEIREEYNARGEHSFLYGYLRNGKLKEKCEENPEKEKAIVHKSATDLMYNLGYALAEKRLETEDYAMMKDGVSQKQAAQRKKKKETAESKKSGKEAAKKKADKSGPKIRTHNTALDLVDAWYTERGHASSVFSESAVDVTDLQKLFIMLNQGRYTQALIPIKVDRVTGGGLYIVGKDLYPEYSFPYDKQYSCGLCIIAEWRAARDKGGVSLNYGEYGNEELGACKNVKEALNFYENSLSENRIEYLTEMQNLNRYMPKNCPESLKQYFADYEEEDDFFDLTEENIAEAKAEVEAKEEAF